MQISEFWTLMNEEFGTNYAPTLARHHVLGVLGGRTIEQSIDEGIDPGVVWYAVCDDMEVPAGRRAGRDVPPASRAGSF